MPTFHSQVAELPALYGGEPIFSADEYVYLIDPAQLNSLDMLLEVYSGILKSARTDYAPIFGPQRYIVKATKSDVFGFRSLLEKRLADFLELDQQLWSVFAVSSGTNALRLALRALLPDRDEHKTEVIIPAITVPATAEAVLVEGLQPVLVDIDPETWNLDIACAEKAASEKTIAIISVDWLGTPVDVSALQHFSKTHNIVWISDSAQSFGAKYCGKPFAGYADATVFSTGYPKVFHTAGRGGILVIQRDQVDNLRKDPTGLLRHEPLCEINAFFGLLILDQFEFQIQRRREIVRIYHNYLSPLPGFIFQKIPEETCSNYYQMSLKIIREEAGISARELSIALHYENIQASSKRVENLYENERLREYLWTPGLLSASYTLSHNSLTLPIANHLKKQNCIRICRGIKRIYEYRRGVEQWSVSKQDNDTPTLPIDNPPFRTAQVLIKRLPAFWDIVKEPITYRTEQHIVNHAEHILVPAEKLIEEFVSVEELLDSIKRSETLCVGSKLVSPFVVDTVLPEGDIIVTTDTVDVLEGIELDGSGSAADVNLFLSDEGRLFIVKKCDNNGIDGNGKPWLRRQIHYLRAEKTQNFSKLFVHPTQVLEDGEEIRLFKPYIHGYSLAENVLRGAGVDFTFSILREVCSQMARKVWTQDIQEAPEDYIQKAHLERMARRVRIAAEHYPQLKEVLNYRKVILNGESLLNFPELLERLKSLDILLKSNPQYLSLVHGDLNIYNIICEIGQDKGISFKLIDPRGTPLLAPDLPIERIEHGDFVYDLAKMKFSLSGFAAIRAGLHSFQGINTNSFELSLISPCLATETFKECDSKFIDFVERNSFFGLLQKSYYEDIDRGLWKDRLLLAEAANFIADSACALGRACSHEVLPFYLLGLLKLNAFYRQHSSQRGKMKEAVKRSLYTFSKQKDESPMVGLKTIREGLRCMEDHPRWDIIEVLVKHESVDLTCRLLQSAMDNYLPSRTRIYISDQPCPRLDTGDPCILIHSFKGNYGQLNAISEGIGRTNIFLSNCGVVKEKAEQARILTIVSTGRSTRNQVFCRANDKLLMPGPKGISPILMLIEQSYQLKSPCPGRWVCNNDGILLLSKNLSFSGKYLGVVGGKRLPLPDGFSTQWKGHISSISSDGENMYIAGFDEIPKDTMNVRRENFSPGVYFFPHHLATEFESLAPMFPDRNLSLVFDIILPYLLQREEWLRLSYRNGKGYRAYEMWDVTSRIRKLFPRVEFISAGDKVIFRHIGSDKEYLQFVKETRLNHYLRVFLDLPEAIAYEKDVCTFINH